MLSRLGDAVKDVAETLRRTFRDPPARSVGLGMRAGGGRPFDGLAAAMRQGLAVFEPVLGDQQLSPQAAVAAPPVGFQSRLQQEGAWASWRSGARVAVMAVFEAKRAGRLEVQVLPRRAACRGIAATGFLGRARSGFDPPTKPASRVGFTGFVAPGCRRALELAFGLPVSVAGEDLRQAPRPLQMRCSLQIVKATGENVRNLDLLGRYWIPKKGVRELRHDAASGRLLLQVGPEAAGSGQALLLLARRKDDRSLLTCFAEDGP